MHTRILLYLFIYSWLWKSPMRNEAPVLSKSTPFLQNWHKMKCLVTIPASWLGTNDSSKFSHWTNYPKMIAWGWIIYHLISIQCPCYRMKEEVRKRKKPLRRWSDKRRAGRRETVLYAALTLSNHAPSQSNIRKSTEMKLFLWKWTGSFRAGGTYGFLKDHIQTCSL